MKRVKEENIITFHPELARAIKGFAPVFANEEDRVIVLSMNKLHKKISSVDNEAFRMMEKNRKTKNLTAKMKDIQFEERSLTSRIISRNLDF